MKCKKCNGTGRVWDNGDKMACKATCDSDLSYDDECPTCGADLNDHPKTMPPDPRDELLRECAEVLKPFITDFQSAQERADKKSPAASKWFRDMPGEFPFTQEVSMGDLRKAAALLAKLEERKG